MKKTLLIILLYCCALTRSYAQKPFATIDTININNIGAAQLVHGDMWWNPANETMDCEYPAGSGKNMNGSGALWMSAYDGSGRLHVSAQTYRQTGNDYWPGPLTNDTLTFSTSAAWAKIWKVNSSDIQAFLSLQVHVVANTPPSILTWPAKGNAYAQGNGSLPLTITTDMAPFVDINGNGIYEPLLGEYPDIKGDQALWCVFSDNGPTHNQTNGKPLGVEVHAMAYAYKRGTLIDDVVYYDYTLVNRSSNTYSNTRMALWDDINLGWYYDDYIGFDSAKRMGIIYERTDNGSGGGHPVNTYGLVPPIPAVTLVALPGDTGTNYAPAGSFVYFRNDASVIGNPVVDIQYNNYMRAKMLNGQHYTNNLGQDCNYVFPGDPSDTTQWSACTANTALGGMRFVLSSNDFTLNAGGAQHIVMALITTDTGYHNTCPGLSFDSIKTVADTAWANYYSPPYQTYTRNIVSSGDIQIYPNPTSGLLYIVNNYSTGIASISIYNTLGQKIDVPITLNGTGAIVDVSSLPTAIYYIVYRKGNIQKTAKFLKE